MECVCYFLKPHQQVLSDIHLAWVQAGKSDNMNRHHRGSVFVVNQEKKPLRDVTIFMKPPDKPTILFADTLRIRNAEKFFHAKKRQVFLLLVFVEVHPAYLIAVLFKWGSTIAAV